MVVQKYLIKKKIKNKHSPSSFSLGFSANFKNSDMLYDEDDKITTSVMYNEQSSIDR